MSLEAETARAEEGLYATYKDFMYLGEWSNARDVIIDVINKEYNVLAQTLQTHYNENVCEDCLGTGRVVEGNFDNQTEKECICQVKK